MASNQTSSQKRARSARQEKKLLRQDEQFMNASQYVTSASGIAVKRIRTPHANDVLSGRGGGINSHVGNVHFRQWVHERKNDYNLAVDKTEKARVAHQIIALVQAQIPPGRFLQKDTSLSSSNSNSWWTELDEEKILAKTSQALREGAPQIRAANKDVLVTKRKKRKAETLASSSLEANKNASIYWSSPLSAPVADHLLHDDDAAWNENETAKRMRYDNDETPPLTPNDAPVLEPEPLELGPPLMPLRDKESMRRCNSLALSDVSLGDALGGDWADEEFVNPFESEQESGDWQQHQQHQQQRSARESFGSWGLSPRAELLRRETSASSDMGGIGALLRTTSSNNNDGAATGSSPTLSTGVRSRNSSDSKCAEVDWSDPLLLLKPDWQSPAHHRVVSS
jgi:hypothetical protein